VKILALSDQVVPKLYSPRVREDYGDVGMVLACGDLPYSYLEYIATMLNTPCFFVHGNHDQPEHLANGSTLTEPGGWVNLHGRVVHAKGLLLAGLEGSIRYRPHAPYQYTESERTLQVWRMAPFLLLNRVRYGRYLDILVTHAPCYGIHDGQDAAHCGFRVYRQFMARFRPRYLLHGHQHVCMGETCETRYDDTDVINVFPSRVIEW
jgi:Icc-related predicted phosphoesterase